MIHLSKCLTEEAVKEPLEKKAARWLHKQLVAEVPVIKKVVKNAKKTEMQLPGFPCSKQKEAAVYFHVSIHPAGPNILHMF